MTSPHEPTRTVDPDGVVRTLHPRSHVARSIFVAGAALALLFVGLALLDGEEDRPVDAEEPAPSATPVHEEHPVAGGPPRAPLQIRGGGDAPQTAIDMTPPADVPPGTKTGIQLFPAPGTKPIKRGLVVPEGFELPPGYVRHYQTLDDGTQLPAVLTFHPDYQPVDAAGRPIPVGEDRLVPEELAPPGMPLQRLVLPGEEPKDAHR